MFKKGDVVTYCGKTEDAGFDVRVTKSPRDGMFSGIVVSANVGSWYENDVGLEDDEWSFNQFKLKQQDVVANNVFPMLKDGMVIETRCRGFYLVCGGKVIRHEGYNRLASYEKDGKYKGSNSKFDIVRVYSGENLYNFDLYDYVSTYPEDLVWEEQKNAKAIAEIEEQMSDLFLQINTLQEKLVTLREEK